MHPVILFLQNLSNKKAFVIFLILGFLIYGNSLFNGFAGDDFGQIKNNKSVHSVLNIPNLFLRSNFYDEGDSQGNNYYKPVLFSSFSLIYFFSFGQPFGFHFVQILVHILNAVLIYLIFKRLFRKDISFFLSLIFLVHPINTEAVAYASALQEPLFLLFGLTALYLSMKEKLNSYGHYAVVILLIMSLLTKEAGFLFILVIPLFNYLYKKKDFPQSIWSGFYALMIYAFLRFLVGQVFFPQYPIVPIMNLSLVERIVNIPKIIFFYLKTFFYPKDLLMFQDWTVKSISAPTFYIPLVLVTVSFLAVLILALIVYRKDKNLFKSLVFFFAWFLLGLGMHLQIVPLDQTVADRWFYFPIIGLLGLTGVLASYFGIQKRLNAKILVLLILVITAAFAVRVVLRNMNWKDRLTLYTHDVKYNSESYQLESGLGSVYASRGDDVEAEKHYVRATLLFPGLDTFSTSGTFYLGNSKFEEAREAFENGLKYDSNNVPALVYLAVSKYKLGDKEGALTAAKKANGILPSKLVKDVLNNIENNGEINFH